MSPKDLPANALDLHVHSAPDIRPRPFDDLDLARACLANGMAGAGIKAHTEPTASRATLAARAVPGARMFGGIVLNRAAGGLNPAAVEAMARANPVTGRVVWLPTRDAEHEIAVKNRSNATVAVVRDGRPVDALAEVLKVVGACDLVLATGHLAPDEGLAVFRAAHAAGLRRLVVTHATAPVSDYDDATLDEMLRLGAVVELCARNIYTQGADGMEVTPHRCDRMAEVMRRCGADACFLSSDLGDTAYPDPWDGLRATAAELRARGISDAALEAALVTVPHALMA